LDPRKGGFSAPGFAVDSEDNLYARHSPFIVSEYSGVPKIEQETYYPALAAPFDAEETSAVAVDLSNNEVFVDSVGFVDAFSTSGSLEERFGSGVLISGSGLAVSHASEYHFEYGRCDTPGTCASSAYEESTPLPDLPVGSDFEVHNVSAHVQDLLAGTTYHFRVAAHNGFDGTEPVEGEEQTFSTQAAGGRLVLPDDRAWEMVSPPDKQGALIEFTDVLQQTSAGGDAITYEARSPTEGDPQGYAKKVQVLSTRGVNGWSSRDIATPRENATGPAIGAGEEYRFF